MKVLVTGAAGPRGRQLTAHLCGQGHEVIGIDRDSWRDPPPNVAFHQLDHRKRGFEELLRQNELDAIVHLAVHAGFRLAPAERHRLNLEGTEKIIELAAAHRITKLVVTSHAAVYGALADNPYFMTEAHPPSVGRSFPEMQDLVTADLLTAAAMWKHPDIEMVVLRPVHAIGPTSRGVLAQLLRRRRVPTVLGYDPMMQVIHEQDLPEAFACALFAGVRGVFNVAGPGEVPLSVLIRESGGEPLSIPETLFTLVRGRFGFPDVPAGAVDFLKHPCLVDGSAFQEATGYAPSHDLRSTLRAMRPASASAA